MIFKRYCSDNTYSNILICWGKIYNVIYQTMLYILRMALKIAVQCMSSLRHENILVIKYQFQIVYVYFFNKKTCRGI